MILKRGGGVWKPEFPHHPSGGRQEAGQVPEQQEVEATSEPHERLEPLLKAP